MERGWLWWAHPWISPALTVCLVAVITFSMGHTVQAEVIVPGSGRKIDAVGDDFEMPGWQYLLNSPKSSRNIPG